MEKIERLRKKFEEEKIDGYLIPKNDEYFGEFVPNFNDRLNYISGFSGTYGFALILKKKNFLFVDGRYTLQAIQQSKNFFKIITIPEKMPCDILKNKKLTIGFDPKLFTKKTIKIFFNRCDIRLKLIKNNLIDKIWKRRIPKTKNKFYALPSNSVGENYKSKINYVVNILKKNNSDYLFITASENCAWLCNIRGKDSKYSPIPQSFILINKNREVKFFCDLNKISLFFKKKFNKIKFFETNSIEESINEIKNEKFIIDKNTCSLNYENIIKNNNKIISTLDPLYHLKAIKSSNEIKNIKKAHTLDGVALTKYIFWIKKNFHKKKISEIEAAKKLLKFRKENKSFKFSSFATISGTGPNGAIIHYRATKKTNRVLKKGDIYLVDSGGQYEFGTTDVTRTISLMNSNSRIKNIFTRVLKGHIAVASYKLKKTTNGSEIDFVARKYLKKIGLDYPHGTGHGVGYFLNVHEGPQAISKSNKVILKKGMILSNEPGYYEKDKFGIRIENLIHIKRANNKNVFEDLTMVPIDKNLIDPAMLNINEINWINKYHEKVFKNLKKFMNKNNYAELKKACSII